MRKMFIAVASLAVVASALSVAPVASAAAEAAQFSTLDSGVAVSGSMSTTLTGPVQGRHTWAEIDFPTSLFNTAIWSGTNPSNCANYSITLAFNGVPQTIRGCELVDDSAINDPVEGNFHALFVQTRAIAQSGDVITLTWGSQFASSISPLAGQTVFVWDSTNSVVVPVVLPAGSSPIPMWQQAIGRPSATAPCPDGYTGSWDTWPNNHTGGYVCNRFVPTYGN